MSTRSTPPMPRRKAAVALLLSSLVPGLPVFAAAPAKLDTVFVTATRDAQPITELLADVTVVDSEAIARSGAGGLVQLLQRQAGIEIVQNGGPAGVSGIFLRGTNRGQTLVLVDGMRVGSSTTGAATLEAIPLDAIERIEILRGPASSLYGSDAIGGVIQVFTRGPTAAPAVGASAGYGTHGTSLLRASVSGALGPVRLSAGVGERRSDGFNAITDAANYSYNPDRDGYRSTDFSFGAALPWADGHELSARVLRNRQNAQYDGGAGFDDRTVTVLESWQVATRDRLLPNWTSRLSVGETTDDSVSKTGWGDYPFRTRQRQFAWQNEFALPIGLLTAGYERREERVATDVAFAVTARDTDALFAVHQWKHDAHALQLSVRHDHSSQFGNETTGAVAYGYRVLPSLRLTASYGTAFKAPSFNDLYYPDYSNPALKPERAKNFEAGAYWSGSVGDASFEARAVGWRNRVSDLIVFQCDASYNCAPQNVDRATLTGVTLGIEGRRADTTFSAALDLGRPRDDRTDLQLPRRAREHGTLSVGQQLGPVHVGVEVVASAHRYDDAANRVRMAGYGIVNLTAEWALSRNVVLWARGDNVLDRNYELASGYGTGGATFVTGVRWQP